MKVNRSRIRRPVWVMTVAIAAIASQVAAQVVIDMPPPPQTRPLPSMASAGTSVASAPIVTPSQMDVGELALRRYSRGRTLPFDTYWNGPNFAGIQQYSIPFPVFWWGGWGGFWPFWGGGCCFKSCL